jgi:pyruvate/2-oxoglutarate dehydrogenase complex dihydrolipoamide acyltransferase (E2) component
VNSSTTDTFVAVVMPKMGISVSEGTVVEWRKKPGDWVEGEETICDVTTDKIDVEIPAPAPGRLQEILVEEGTTVDVGVPIARIDAGAIAGEAHPDEDESGPAQEAPSSAPPGAEEIDRSGFFSPVVQRIAEKHKVDLGRVQGHGVGGRIRKRDLLAHIEARRADRPLHGDSPYVAAHQSNGHAVATEPESPAVDPGAPPGSNGTHREPMSPMRRTIAEHMVRSIATSAHCTTIVEVDFAAVVKRRAAARETMSRRGVKLTHLALGGRAPIPGRGGFPVLNASVENDEIVFHDDVNLGIAVSVDDGLVVPVIRQAQRLGVEGLAVAIAERAAKARTRALEPDDVTGGTFTITNPGQFGAVLATPIINQPQVAILDLEAIVDRAVVIDGAIAIRPMAYLPLSWDHRALDGAMAARFLGRVKQRLEKGEQ